MTTKIDAASQIAGLLPLANGGTNADLSASGSATAVLAQDAAHVVTARALIAADIPSLDASKITTGQLALARGGTAVDLSAAGSATAFLAQDAAHLITARSIIAADVPNLDASKITTGQLALARGGTNADLSATGGANQILKQSSVGGAITVAKLVSGDIPPATSATFSALWGGLGLGNLVNTFTPPTSSTGFTANVSFVHLFYISEPITVSKVTIFVATVAAGTAASCGIYDTSGNKLVDSGVFTTTAGGTGTGAATNSISAVLLPQGWYYQCFTSNSLSNGFEYFSGGAANILTMLNKNGVRVGNATATTGGAQNASLGAVTISSAAALTNVAACLYE